MKPKVSERFLTVRKSRAMKGLIKVWQKHYPLTNIRLKHRTDGPAFIGNAEIIWYENGIAQKTELKPEYTFLLDNP